jgi:hypothetical protein
MRKDYPFPYAFVTTRNDLFSYFEQKTVLKHTPPFSDARNVLLEKNFHGRA